jgi:hypothetical protein
MPHVCPSIVLDDMNAPRLRLGRGAMEVANELSARLAARRRVRDDVLGRSTLCALAVAVPTAVDFFNNWFHGLDLRLLRPPGGGR